MKRLLLFAILYTTIGCGAPPPTLKSQEATIPSGTELKLALGEPLSAGSSKEGTPVTLIVAEPLLLNGQEVIREGTLVRGAVTWSRSEGTLSAIANQPARLAISIDTTVAIDGSPVKLSAASSGEPTFQFTRENTSQASLEVSAALEDSVKRQLLETLVKSVDESKPIDLDASQREILAQIAKDAGMNETVKAISEQGDGLSSMLKTLSTPRGLAQGFTGGQTGLLLEAAGQVFSLVDQVGSKLSRMTKGRTIRAPIGMRVSAYVIEDVTVRLP